MSAHPALKVDHPAEFFPKFVSRQNSKKDELFDVIVTSSSLEHAGLGRYGDMLNPYGDLLALARAWCVSKRTAVLLLSVPTDLPKAGRRRTADGALEGRPPPERGVLERLCFGNKCKACWGGQLAIM